MNVFHSAMALTVAAGLLGSSLASAGGYGRYYGHMPPPPPPPYFRAPYGSPYGHPVVRPSMPHQGTLAGTHPEAGNNKTEAVSRTVTAKQAADPDRSPDVLLPRNGDLTLASQGAGHVLANSRGMTLYTFSQDQTGRSNCSGSCAESWPPVIATEDARPEGDFSLVPRGNGNMQWAYEGRPLYTWIADRNPGDATGDGAGGVWRAVRL